MTNAINYILKKRLKDIKIILDLTELEKKNQSKYFRSDRTTNLQFSKFQMKFTGHWLQYHAKCYNPLYRKSEAIKFAFILVVENLTRPYM